MCVLSFFDNSGTFTPAITSYEFNLYSRKLSPDRQAQVGILKLLLTANNAEQKQLCTVHILIITPESQIYPYRTPLSNLHTTRTLLPNPLRAPHRLSDVKALCILCPHFRRFAHVFLLQWLIRYRSWELYP